MPPQPLTIQGRPAITPVAPPVTAPPVATAPTQTAAPAIDPKIINLAMAIRQTESGGNYSAKGASGEFGAYQFEPDTWNATAPKYGVNVPLQQATREQQNEVAVKQLQEWSTEHPDWNIGNFASAWNAGAGKPNAYLEGNAGTNSSGVKYDTAAYAKNVALAYQAIKSGQSNPQQQTQPTAPSAPANRTAVAPASSPDILSRASDILNTIFPNKNIGDLLGTELDKLFPNTFIPAAVAPSNAASPTITGAQQVGNIAPTSATIGNVSGDLLQDAAWLVGGGEAAAPIEEASTLGRVGAAALQGAKAGAIGGSLSGAGNALSNNENLVDAGVGAVTGGLEGGAAGGVLGSALSFAPKIIGRVANGGVQSTDNAIDEVAGNLFSKGGAVKPGSFAPVDNAENRAVDTAGQILQGTKAQAEQAVPVLSNVNTQGVKTYEDLSNRIQTAVDQHQGVVNKELATNNTPVKLSDLGQKISSTIPGSKLSTKVNYVSDALKQLKELYTATRDIPSSLRITELTTKAKTQGLTPTEVNDIAKEYGTQFRAKGFSKVGQPLTSVNDQAFENTRKGLKTTARSFLTSDAAQKADQATSKLLNVKTQVDKVAQKVNALSQRVQKRNIVEKIARSLGHGVDIATGGAIKSFVSKLFFPSNVGLKTFNALDLESRLTRNLRILDRLDGSTDTQVENFIKTIIGGLVQKR